LYFFIFSCFSKAREAVKRTSEVEFSYIELTFKDGHPAQSEMCWVPVIFRWVREPLLRR
jgi:hypothetical protein